MPAVVVLSTFPSEAKAAEISRLLVEERLCACANLVPAVRSIYRWKDELCDEAEALAIIKTTSERVDALRERIVALHPYDIPEVIVLPIEGGHAAYLAWLAES
jgi:periplasmic divalent cation tolerance protein